MSWLCLIVSLFCLPHRYRLSGMIIPGLKDWFEGTFGASLQHKTPATVSVIHHYFVASSVTDIIARV